MRKILFALVLFISLSAKSQEKIQQYCTLVSRQKLMNLKNVAFDIDYGNNFSLEKVDTSLIQIRNPQIISTLTDALNFLGRDGWQLVTSYALLTTDANSYQYIFKKEFDKSLF